MTTLPAEILIAITDALTSDTQLRAYTYSPAVKATLRDLGLVNWAFYEWSNGLLYRRVTVSDGQIDRLEATLSLSTPRAISLAKRIHSIRLSVTETGANLLSGDKHVSQASALLHILARYSTVKRLFMDMALTSRTIDLQNAIGSFTTLSELVLGNIGEGAWGFFWMIELAARQYNCLTTLQSLTILDVNICTYSDMRVVLPQLTSIEELVIIRPWGSLDLEPSGRILAELFTPPRSLRWLTIILGCGWEEWPLQCLRVEDFGAAMIPHIDQLLILPRGEPRGSLMSWNTIRDMIGAGHRWETGLE